MNFIFEWSKQYFTISSNTFCFNLATTAPCSLKLSKLPYFFCGVSESEPPKLEDAFCSIVIGGLRSSASAEASGGLRGLRKLWK